ncbi:UDP-N-acetylmuramoyl-L-alanine--D-glutamate ligase [Aestuariibacter halophilus]|uniref:UDP-N-acetylmuramoylalanine--D-glutamate ligase n=1 Tax=Fluctibacter halophilus TaxID=226011 RepID=A0ABS8G7C6_9ALTE|nr:UDP-N-acetylmuramoyl-L-alanine--D-glutamate ligase [Aestuariibacter halophilus]MCC2616450.1 UDP-N-acetylmuramoyl-L-alanine--D-glutamate ligase [Aestuariibacter halophilus]
MPISTYENMQVVVVGLGLTGTSCVRYLQQQGAHVIGMDSRSDVTLDCNIPLHLGTLDADVLSKADLIVASPGVDTHQGAFDKARAAGVAIIGDVELFARANQAKVIAVTGSNGKSTVVTLIHAALKACGQRVALGGNIGTPVLELLDLDADIMVLELSSFQLETTQSLTPQVAAVLNVSDDHLDRHGTLTAYQQAKLRIYQGASQCVYNRTDPLTYPPHAQIEHSIGLDTVARGWGWNEQTRSIEHNGEVVLEAQACRLQGRHNMLNLQAVLACLQPFVSDWQPVWDALTQFEGLPHRFQTVSIKGGVCWINDSKATNVGATLAAIEGVLLSAGQQLIVIAGGVGKGADFSPLQDVFQQRVGHLITLGQDGPTLAALKPGSQQVASMAEAVSLAKTLARSGDVVLLAPACASLDMFANYQARGDAFAQAIEELAA